MPSRRALASLLPLALTTLFMGGGIGGCAAAACRKVHAEHQDFLHRRGPADAAQLVVAVPLATLGQALSFPLARLPAMSVPMPDLDLPIDLDLGNLEIALRSVQVVPAPDGQLGLRVRFVLRSRGRDVTAIDLDAVVAPQIEPGAGSVRLSLRPQDLLRVRPSLPPGERQKFAAFIAELLPQAARALIGGRLDKLADQALSEFIERSFPRVRDGLLGHLKTLVDLEIDLPPVPLTRVALRSPGADLELWLSTSLPAAGLAPGPARAPGGDPRLVQVRMSGGTAAELANQAMTRGQIPARYDLAGEPSPTGEFTAGVAWQPGPRPLRLHAWKQSGVCAHVVFAGTPSVDAVRGELDLRVPDAQIERITGAARARIAAWYSGLGKQTFAFSQAVAGATSFELLGIDYDATPVRAAVVADTVTIDLQLAPRAPARRP
ncbi:MAG: hypothetical protein IPO88_33215 [Nannocystis sp.]|uniref:hypothetical protein n=1 Tax=Nannocystis sp. TaxID=1962667 RepID=UPI0024276256|nr:hypothetical protein [Nannocystis sp.]MBK9758293.1 hypothetical protein [Nannocystis sp.]